MIQSFVLFFLLHVKKMSNFDSRITIAFFLSKTNGYAIHKLKIYGKIKFNKVI